MGGLFGRLWNTLCGLLSRALQLSVCSTHLQTWVLLSVPSELRRPSLRFLYHTSRIRKNNAAKRLVMTPPVSYSHEKICGRRENASGHVLQHSGSRASLS